MVSSVDSDGNFGADIELLEVADGDKAKEIFVQNSYASQNAVEVDSTNIPEFTSPEDSRTDKHIAIVKQRYDEYVENDGEVGAVGDDEDFSLISVDSCEISGTIYN
jgi:hypothetical protein